MTMRHNIMTRIFLGENLLSSIIGANSSSTIAFFSAAGPGAGARHAGARFFRMA